MARRDGTSSPVSVLSRLSRLTPGPLSSMAVYLSWEIGLLYPSDGGPPNARIVTDLVRHVEERVSPYRLLPVRVAYYLLDRPGLIPPMLASLHSMVDCVYPYGPARRHPDLDAPRPVSTAPVDRLFYGYVLPLARHVLQASDLLKVSEPGPLEAVRGWVENLSKSVSRVHHAVLSDMAAVGHRRCLENWTGCRCLRHTAIREVACASTADTGRASPPSGMTFKVVGRQHRAVKRSRLASVDLSALETTHNVAVLGRSGADPWALPVLMPSSPIKTDYLPALPPELNIPQDLDRFPGNAVVSARSVLSEMSYTGSSHNPAGCSLGTSVVEYEGSTAVWSAERAADLLAPLGNARRSLQEIHRSLQYEHVRG